MPPVDGTQVKPCDPPTDLAVGTRRLHLCYMRPSSRRHERSIACVAQPRASDPSAAGSGSCRSPRTHSRERMFGRPDRVRVGIVPGSRLEPIGKQRRALSADTTLRRLFAARPEPYCATRDGDGVAVPCPSRASSTDSGRSSRGGLFRIASMPPQRHRSPVFQPGSRPSSRAISTATRDQNRCRRLSPRPTARARSRASQ